MKVPAALGTYIASTNLFRQLNRLVAKNTFHYHHSSCFVLKYEIVHYELRSIIRTNEHLKKGLKMSEAPPYYNVIDHTADLGIIVHGANQADLYEKAGMALMHLMVDVKASRKPDFIDISIEGDDPPDLMVRWLGEILYLFSGESLIVTHINIKKITSKNLMAFLGTIPFDENEHLILSEIKAVTYHQIEVTEKNNTWEARVIFDL